MPSNIARYRFVYIPLHWILVLMSCILLGFGWYVKYIHQEPQTRNFLLNIHMSFGLTSAILISILIVLRIVFKPPPLSNEFPRRQKLLVYTIYLLIYVSFTLMLISGYLQATFSGTPLQFWGAPLPVWGCNRRKVSRLFCDGTCSRCFCIGRIDFRACLYRRPEYIQIPWNCGTIAATWDGRVAGACLAGSEIPNYVKDNATISEKTTSIRLDRILVAVLACLNFRNIIDICRLRARIRPSLGRVWRWHLLGWLRIFAIMFCGLFGLLLHASRPKSRCKTGCLF